MEESQFKVFAARLESGTPRAVDEQIVEAFIERRNPIDSYGIVVHDFERVITKKRSRFHER